MGLMITFFIFGMILQSFQVKGNVSRNSSSELLDTTDEDNTCNLYIASKEDNCILKTNGDIQTSPVSLQRLPFTTSGSVNYVTVEPVEGRILWGEKHDLWTWKLDGSGCGLGKIDLVFIVDVSESIGTEENFNRLLEFLKAILKNADIDSGSVRVGIVSFSTTVSVEFKMNEYTTHEDVFRAISKIPWKGHSTNTHEALRITREQMFTTAGGDRDDAPNVVILITDGMSSFPGKTLSESVKVKHEGIHIYVVGIGEIQPELFNIASSPASETLFFVADFGELKKLDLQRFRSICLANTLTGAALDWTHGILYIGLNRMRSVITLKLLSNGDARLHETQIDVQPNIKAIDSFHRKLYQVPVLASDIINEITLDKDGRVYDRRLIIDLNGTPISYIEVDSKDGRLYYVTAVSQPIIYTFNIDEGKPKQIIEAKGFGFTSYGHYLYWIENSFNSSYKIIKLSKDNHTHPKTVFESKKEIAGFAVSGLKKSNNTETSWWNRKVSECLSKDGNLHQLTSEMICNGNADCYGDFDEFHCCYDTPLCGLKDLKIHCTNSNYNLDPNNVFDLKLPFSKLLFELFSFSTCKIKGIFVDMYGIQRSLYIDYFGQYYAYRQLVKGDVFQRVKLINSMEITSFAITSLKENVFLNFQSLTKLAIKRTALTDIQNKAFIGLDNLEELYLAGNSYLQTIDKNTFHGLSSVRYLDISDNALTDLDPDTLTVLKSLQTIDLRGNGFRFTNIYFKANNKLAVIYADSYIVCCMKPPTVTDDNCKTPKDAITGCKNLINDGILRVLLWLIGIVALLGNMTVIVYRVLGAEKPKNESFFIFVTNLTLSDGLMGIYILTIAFHDVKYAGQYAFNEHSWKNSALCKVSGTLSFISSEASVFFILFITIDRILAVKYPIGGPRINRKIAYVLSLFAWIISSVAAIIPGEIYHQFYSYSGVCVALPMASEYFDGQFYSIAVFLGFNFVTFVLIAFGQYFIFREIQLSSRRVRSTFTSRDRDAAKMLMMVVITDCFCWLPIGILIIMSQAGFKVPDVVYAWIVVFILPINSAINPFLYTLGPEIKKKFVTARNRSRTRSSNET